MQGSTDERRFVALYGHHGRTVAAVTFDQGKWLEFYLDQIERAGPFPPQYRNVGQPEERQVSDADFPDPVVPTEAPMIVRTGHSPTGKGVDPPSRARGAAMTSPTTTGQPGLLAQILDFANRADPYPLFAELRKTPVFHAANGSYVISNYRDIWSLMHDPRIGVGGFVPGGGASAGAAGGQGGGSFIGMDPPAHDRMRRLATTHFEQTEAVRPDMLDTATELIDRMRGKQEIDLVDDFAYPLPVSVICRQLGVPHEDEPRFHPWAEAIITQLDPRPGQQEAAVQASAEMNAYMAGLVERFRAEPGSGLLSGLATVEGLATEDVVATGRLLLIAGHETTVNLITNGMLTLLRHPEVLERLRHEPELAIPLVENSFATSRRCRSTRST